MSSDNQSPRGVDLEIIDRGGAAGVFPNCVRINGTEVLIPSNTEIWIEPITSSSCVTVRLTLFVQNLTVRTEPKD
ncbi:hypothetical protein CCUG60885_04257 [Mycobacteroides salmoniphilum]|uniref:Uncharacterized protein n=1 Tax=Mycobacteroides salmoniphilum TaxID=404941 RepID=A0A4R8SC25_9MYCO|nr:hypothetical protein CCUG60885_04257 [Mycobacteroides salmoniphilum]TEA07372.1 hypothetical protein CCUG60883_01405 [Mycobacteroides salmoniphilum]